MVIFRSAVAVFYRLARRHRYRSEPFHRARFGMGWRRRNERAEVKTIVHGVSEILFATKIAFGGLHGCMPQQKLYLLQPPTAAVA